MIYGLGTRHSDDLNMRGMKHRPGGIHQAIEELSPDTIFVEGLQNEKAQKIYLENRQEIHERINEELPDVNAGELISQADIDAEGAEIKTLEDLNHGKEVSFLDSGFQKEKMIYSVVEAYRQNKEQRENSGLMFGNVQDYEKEMLGGTKEDLTRSNPEYNVHKKLEEDNLEEDDVLEFFRSIRDQEDKEIDYAAMGDEIRFDEFLDYAFETYIRFGTSGSIVESFKEEVETLGVGRKELQSVLLEQSNTDFQSRRDESWAEKVSGHMNENPDEDILAIGGLYHFLDLPETFVGQMKDRGYEVDTYPLDHFTDDRSI